MGVVRPPICRAVCQCTLPVRTICICGAHWWVVRVWGLGQGVALWPTGGVLAAGARARLPAARGLAADVVRPRAPIMNFGPGSFSRQLGQDAV